MTYPIVFLSYDEPNADENYAALKTLEPRALRVHGVKGLDAAHKEAARQARLAHQEAVSFFTVDGDNRLLATEWLKLTQQLPENKELVANNVLSWRAINPLNGLCYGNGGLKLWPIEWVQNMVTHEAATDHVVDFCWEDNYIQMEAVITKTLVNGSAYQAFRAGFREGIKMMTRQGRSIDRHALYQAMTHTNVRRFLVWASIGADEPFGRYAILGALLGFQYTTGDEFKKMLLDHDAVGQLWESVKMHSQADIEDRIDSLRYWAQSHAGLAIPKLGPLQSKTCKLLVEQHQPSNLFKAEEWNNRISTLS